MSPCVVHGEAVAVLAGLEAESMDAVVTDPPYAISFMGRKWDAHDSPKAFQAWCETWATEALRVLKPGGHALVFGGTRTYHRMTCGLEDAGFEIRDCIAWMHGSGFPKSLDVSKAIDKQRDDRDAVLRVTIALADASEKAGVTRDGEVWRLNGRKGTPGDAWGWREIVGERRQRGRPAITAAPFNAASAPMEVLTAPATSDAERWQGWGTALKPAFEPIVVARKPFKATVAANVLEHGTGAINVDGCRVSYESGGTLASNPSLREAIAGGNGGHVIATETDRRFSTPKAEGRWPANVILDEEAGALLDAQAGACRSAYPNNAARAEAYVGTTTAENGVTSIPQNVAGLSYADHGGASRFFYCAKADTAERNAGLGDGASLFAPYACTCEPIAPPTAATFGSSSKPSRSAEPICANCGGVIGGARRNDHPT
jgi:site-specific DNA-methyltransferase (adenine-specific)